VIEFLSSLDIAAFIFVNTVLSNTIGDVLWPAITDYDRQWPVRVVLLVAWIALLVKGGRRGRTAALLLIPVLVVADQFSSAVLKELVSRPRPCHTVNGNQVLPYIHLLVHCGGGKSFPSSHAVNNVAVATLFGWYYRRYAWAFFAWALLVGISRVAVGVHYPSDIIGGAVVGATVSFVFIALWNTFVRIIPVYPPHNAGRGKLP
jgi:undecaprenyl-diphosphatase